MRCIAKTCKSEQCKNQTEAMSAYCRAHIRQKSFTFDQEANERARAELKAYNRRKVKWKRKNPEGYYPKRLPESYHEMVCGAKTRAGSPCKRRDLFNNGRCPLHGGLSTGPLSKEGKAKAADHYLRHAVTNIDDRLGEGYAAKHPELIGSFMQTAAIDFTGAIIAKMLGDIADNMAGEE